MFSTYEEPDRPELFPRPEEWFDPDAGVLKRRYSLGAVAGAQLILEPRRSRGRAPSDTSHRHGFHLYLTVREDEHPRCSREFHLLMQTARTLSAIASHRSPAQAYEMIGQGRNWRGEEKYFVCSLAPAEYVVVRSREGETLYQIEKDALAPINARSRTSRVKLTPRGQRHLKNASRGL
jgi:hypothetical protein